ncbi:hypothetical protein KKB40_04095, partial [Patescibacteria group bacterium]|nr:hypothetical protein [Patescibacteria group bacterium]
LSSSEVIKKVSDAEILIAGSSGINRIDKELLVGLTKLKFVSLLTIGTNWIDLEHAKKKGIVVSNAKGGTAESVAEHIWGMILGLSKRINEFERDVKDKGAYKFTDYKGMEVYGKTIGIIGLGDIGIKVARIARAFQMKVIGINKSGRKIAGVYLVSLDELLRKSDVIAVCIPLVEETKNMISKAEIKKMKDGVVLVNCAREEIVDKRIVLQGIKSGKIFGYGVETEIMKPVSNNDPYLKFSNVIVTPHNAFNTKEGELRVNDLMIENIKTYLKGKPINVVN